MKKKTRQLLILNGLLILIVAAAILSVNSGYARIPFSAAVHSIFQPHMEDCEPQLRREFLRNHC